MDAIVRGPDSGRSLKGDLEGLWSFRLGRFRIIYRFEAVGDIELVAVGPRKAIYQEIRRLRHRR